jgi:hypothetical protein
MTNWQRTFVFVGVAVVAVGLAALVNHLTQPEPMDQFGRVGEAFFEDFEPSKAKSLEVVVFDKNTSRSRKFRVEMKDGLWTIPTHHDYPAEATKRLAETVATVMGIERESLAGRRKKEHERFGVVDPNADDITDPESVGTRITIGGEGEEPLADFIIGKQVGEDDEEDSDGSPAATEGDQQTGPAYYVRRPDEEETYRAHVKLADVSTEFTDWIEPDILQLKSADENNGPSSDNYLGYLGIRNYEVERREVQVQQGPFIIPTIRYFVSEMEELELTKDGQWGSWKLEGLDDENEELKSSEITDVVSALENLEIKGVRPKAMINGEPLLGDDLGLREIEVLKNDREAAIEAMDVLSADLAEKGFLLTGGEDEPTRLMSDKGELKVASNAGIVYHLYFGSVFTGDSDSVEVGGDEKKVESTEEGEESGDDDERNRYLLVRVDFDESYMDEKPERPAPPMPPVKPVPPTPPNLPLIPDGPVDGGETPADDKPVDDTEPTDDTEATDPDVTETDEPTVDKEEVPPAPTPDPVAETEPPDGEDTADGTSEEASEEADETEASDEAVDETADADAETEDGNGSEVGDDTEEKPKSEFELLLEKYQEDLKAYEDELAAFPEQEEQYRKDLDQYEQDVKEYKERIEKSKEKVEKLRERFANWYYVISAKDLEDLRLTRSELVSLKEKEGDEEDTGETTGSDAGADPADGDMVLPRLDDDTVEDDSADGDATPNGADDATPVDKPAELDREDKPPTADEDEETKKATPTGETVDPPVDDAADEPVASEKGETPTPPGTNDKENNEAPAAE